MDKETTFPESTITRLFSMVSFSDTKTRISQETLALATEYLRIFTREAIWRADQELHNEIEKEKKLADQGADFQDINDSTDQHKKRKHNNNNALDVEHLETIAGTLVLDF